MADQGVLGLNAGLRLLGTMQRHNDLLERRKLQTPFLESTSLYNSKDFV
jgi:hypothetical protein